MTEEKSHVGMEACFFCGQEKGVVLDRKLRKSLPRKAVYNHEPCNECAELMKQGIIIIEVRDGEQGGNPYRTGKQFVLKEEAVERVFDKESAEQLLQKRCGFMEENVAKQLGLHQQLEN